jgi:16S rRNA (guanine527-N7)-methyltransferase
VSASKALAALEFQEIAGVSRETLGRLGVYAELLRKWNRAINLVAADSLEDLWRRHMLDSSQLAPLLPAGGPRIADLGSGAGFPGLVLAILGCGEVHLVESDRRKAQFLREVSRETAAAAQVHQSRIEDLSPLSAAVVVARGLAPLDRLLDYVARHLAPGGQALLPKGQDWERELAAARARWRFAVQVHPSRTHAQGRIQGRILAISALERR